jgi:hypothetical protein
MVKSQQHGQIWTIFARLRRSLFGTSPATAAAAANLTSKDQRTRNRSCSARFLPDLGAPAPAHAQLLSQLLDLQLGQVQPNFEPRFDSPTAEPDSDVTVPRHSPDSARQSRQSRQVCLQGVSTDSPDMPRQHFTSTLPQKLDTDHASVLSSTVKLSSTLLTARQPDSPIVPDSA